VGQTVARLVVQKVKEQNTSNGNRNVSATEIAVFRQVPNGSLEI
jgi:hypothetical protein